MKVLCVVGTRPNFMKVASLHRSFLKHQGVLSKIVHTGQHYDPNMSDVFFDQLELPRPEYFLNINSGTPTEQTARIMIEFEKILLKDRPDFVLVVGDVNSTIACAMAAVKEQVPVVHVEAGLRSWDRKMPEEINRIMTDCIADQLFVTEQSAIDNLKREGISDEKIHFVGNVMIDSLEYFLDKAINQKVIDQLKPEPASYVLMTMHRASNVDEKSGLLNILNLISEISKFKTVLFPMHPRTLKNIQAFRLEEKFESIQNLQIFEPQGYLEFIYLMKYAVFILTDSGGVQEESTYLKVPCITFRETTERPVTVDLGTNYLISDLEPVSVLKVVDEILRGNAKQGVIPPLWDGKASDRIVDILIKKYNEHDS